MIGFIISLVGEAGVLLITQAAATGDIYRLTNFRSDAVGVFEASV